MLIHDDKYPIRVWNLSNMRTIWMHEFSGGGKDIKELKQGVISLIIAILSNLRMGSDGLGKRFFQFTHTVNKVLKSGKEQTY